MALTSEQKEKARRYAVLPYHIKITADECDGQPCYVATHLELVGCTAHGATKEEAIANAKMVRIEYIELLIENGAKIPLPRTIVRVRANTLIPASPQIRFTQGAPKSAVESRGGGGVMAVNPVKSDELLTEDETLEFEMPLAA